MNLTCDFKIDVIDIIWREKSQGYFTKYLNGQHQWNLSLFWASGVGLNGTRKFSAFQNNFWFSNSHI